MKVNPGSCRHRHDGLTEFLSLHIPEPTTTKAPKRKGQTHEVLFVFTETPSLPLNTRLTSDGINYHVSARNLTQERKEGHSLPRGLAGGQRGPGDRNLGAGSWRVSHCILWLRVEGGPRPSPLLSLSRSPSLGTLISFTGCTIGCFCLQGGSANLRGYSTLVT